MLWVLLQLVRPHILRAISKLKPVALCLFVSSRIQLQLAHACILCCLSHQLRLTPSAYSYIQFSASKATTAPQNDSSKAHSESKDLAENVELSRARVEITELRLQLRDLESGLSDKISELADSQREISRLQSLVQSR